MVLGTVTALNAVGRPHDLIATSFFDDNLAEQFLAGVIFAEGNMISSVPVPTAHDDIPAWLFAQGIDRCNNVSSIADSETTCDKVVLHINDDESGLAAVRIV